MSPSRSALGLAAALAAIAAGPAPAADGAATFTFSFAPPEGTEFVETLATERERAIAGLGRHVDRAETRSVHSVRREGEDYLLVSTLVASRLSRDDQAQSDVASRLLENVAITYRIGADGQIREIRGFDALMRKVEALLPAEVAAALAPALSEKALVARETAQWNGRIGFFAGLSLQLGQTLEGGSHYTLASGESLAYTVRTRLAALEPCPPGQCLRIEVRYDSDAAALDRPAAEVAGELSAAIDAAEPVAARISGSASRLMDPRTMLVYAESSSRAIAMHVAVPGRGRVAAIQTETRRHSFAFR